MIEAINRYARQGWHIGVNNNYQVVFTDPDTNTFFCLNNPTKSEVDYIQSRKYKQQSNGIGLRKRFIY